MKSITRVLALATVLVVSVIGANSFADLWNKKTYLTVNRSFTVPGAQTTARTNVFPAGTYTFKLLDSPSNRHVVLIYNPEETHLFATVLAIPAYRTRITGESVFIFKASGRHHAQTYMTEAKGGKAELVVQQAANEPVVLKKWFYPGDNFGQEFVGH